MKAVSSLCSFAGIEFKIAEGYASLTIGAIEVDDVYLCFVAQGPCSRVSVTELK